MSKSNILTKQTAVLPPNAWRDELVCSAAQAKDFLIRELDKLGIKSKLAWKISAQRDGERTFEISADVRGCDAAAFYAQGRIFEHALIIDGFEVGGCRGQNLSLIGLKALIGIAAQHTQGMCSIDLIGVQEDGPRYWAHLGAMPEQHGEQLFSILLRLINQAEEKQLYPLRGSERAGQLMEVFGLAKEFPALAFRKLSQIKRATDEPDIIDVICDSAMRGVCAYHPNKILVIDLMDAGSLRILSNKLGKIPLQPSLISFNRVAIEASLRKGQGLQPMPERSEPPAAKVVGRKWDA